MHKGIIIIVKASNREDALKATREFLRPYQDDVWDWYQIGGRWSTLLAPKHILDKFYEEAEKILKKGEHGYLYQNEVDAKMPQLVQLWKDVGGIGTNPYFSQYKLPKEGGAYDVLPLKDCIENVFSYSDVEDKKKEAVKWIEEYTEGEKKNESYAKEMIEYHNKTLDELNRQVFSFDCNVFNVEAENYSIPENYEEFYAVIVDIHN